MFERKQNLVSIVITSYNMEAYIEDCLNSLLDQTYKELEIIIVDDCSTDQTVQVIENWINSKNPSIPVHFAKLPKNVGFASAITTGFSLASGEYIAVQDGDDLSDKHRIEKQVAYLQKNPSIALVGTNYSVFKNDRLEEKQSVYWIKFGEEILKEYGRGGHCVCHGTIMFRGEYFDLLGGPTRRIKGAEDYEFIVKFIHAKLKIDNMPDVLYYYRVHDMQRSKEFYEKGANSHENS